MLTGELPYEGQNYNSLLVKIITEDPTPAEKRRSDLSPGMAAIIRKAIGLPPSGIITDAR